MTCPRCNKPIQPRDRVGTLRAEGEHGATVVHRECQKNQSGTQKFWLSDSYEDGVLKLFEEPKQ